MTKSTKPSCPKCGSLIPKEAPRGLCPKCVLEGAATVPATSPSRGKLPPTIGEVAAQFPEFEIIELIGAGGMGAVYKARQPKLERFVAIKILSHDLAEDSTFAERFNREARVLARLNHPNIVTVFDFGSKGPFLFLLMEYVDGVNLRQAMQSGGFTPSDSLDLVQEICSALQFAHEEGILHRDIKPENILIDSRGRVKIADFGIAKLIGKEERDDLTLTSKDVILGSPHYMAPEQIEKPLEVDQRADIYSLGVVFYELLTGELPIGRFAPPSRNNPMDSRIDEVVMRTLEKERERRYQSVEEVKTSVEAITRSAATDTKPSRGAETVASAGSTRTRSDKDTAKSATASAVLTGISLMVFLVLVFGLAISFSIIHRGIGIFELLILSALPLLAAGVTGILGFVSGAKALTEIRESEGRKRGLGRVMFGTLTWPLLIIISLTSVSTAMGFMAMFGPGLLWYLCAIVITVVVGVLVILAVWRWAKGIPRGVRSHDHPAMSGGIGSVAAIAAIIVLLPTLLILVPWGMFTLTPGETRHGDSQPEIRGSRPESFADVDWRLDRPEIELDLTIAPMHVATIAMVRTDASGKEESLNLAGWAIAPDERTFRGRVLIGSQISLDQNGKPRWVFGIEQFGGTYIKSDGNLIAVGGPSLSSSGDTLSGDWVFDPKLPNKLDLTAEGRHSMIVASPARDYQGTPLSTDTLTLRVITQHRSGPGVPEDPIKSGIVGGGSTDWAGSLNRRFNRKKSLERD